MDVATRDIEQLILDAERFAAAAEHLSRSEILRSRSDRELTDAIALGESDEAARLIDAAEDSDARAQHYESVARQEAERFGLVARWPPESGPAELAEQGRELLAQLRSLDGIPGHIAERIAQVELRLSRVV
jgi:hypothetical protein